MGIQVNSFVYGMYCPTSDDCTWLANCYLGYCSDRPIGCTVVLNLMLAGF